ARARVAIAESKDLGGTCVNVGCIPKKLMSYGAHFHQDFADAAGFGWTVGETSFDWAALIAAKDKEIARLNGIYRKILEGAKVDIVEGHAAVEDAHTVSVNGKRYTAAHILVGGRPMVPEIPGKELGIVSDDFFHLTALPKRSVVLGGGYIAVELASILNGLGSEVTLVYRGKSLLRGMDSELGIFLAEEMRKKGMNILFENNIDAIASDGAGKRVKLSDGKTVDADCVLFATGRHPNTAGLGLEKVGVALTAKGAVKVDQHFVSDVASIHAIGDVIDRVALTPVALAEGMVVAARLFNQGGREMSYENIPTAVFSHPNVGTVGLGEEDARKKVGEVRIFKSEFKALKHTLSGNAERTFMKLVVDAKNDRVLGVHMVGADAGEIVQGFAVALQCGATKAQFDATIGIHPTSAEEFVTMRTPVA
ncbi:glutathione-disulfide reductase, partial [Herbaspirillum lusitanum]|uniref:glutathione-disulfide reductase n=1 Tax=Herbaspirillum lusitanum TaxID=213312 RepID=UPI00036200C1